MCLKLELSKAFDSIKWDFIEAALKCFNFPTAAVKWIMECFAAPAYSILINGKPCGFFNSKRGLRQGCPLSPYLYCLVMEFFSASISKCAKYGLIPTPFVKGSISISHLLYANDVKLFASADIQVAGNIRRLLEDLSRFTGPHTNCDKSSILYSNCEELVAKHTLG